MGVVENLESLLAKGQDSSMLRFGLGNAYLANGLPETAAKHLRAAVTQDPNYSAAWKLLGKALTDLDLAEQAMDAYRKGIEAAQHHGDVQAAKEMAVFLKRLEKDSAKR